MSDTPHLTLKEGLELALVTGGKVTAHWNQFYTYLFALIGWMSSSISEIGPREATIITGTTIVYMTLNAVATVRVYTLLSLIVEETILVARTSTFLSEDVQTFVRARNLRLVLPLRIPIALLGHAVGGAAVIHLAWQHASH